MRIKKCYGLILVLIVTSLAGAKDLAKEVTSSALKAMGAPNNPKVEIPWNRYYDHSELVEIGQRLAGAHPNLIKMGSIGTSVEGRDIILLTVTNFKSGDADKKPAMYIDGNIHSNELQGSEVALYTAWYLAENYGAVDWITELLDRKTFYIVPTINPDARDYFIHKVNSPRSGMLPRDDDGDGLLDEDPPDDLDGDGNLVMMRRKNPNGRWKADPDDPRRMVYAKPEQKGEYELLGSEGIDNDGDGLVNEDGPGFYDANRNWAWGWAPSYVQYGADQYPFSIPEDRAVADFVLAHKNIAGAQSYHNSGGIILRGPGEKSDTTYNRQDIQIYDVLAKIGKDTYRFDKLLLFEEGIVPWKEVNHPQYGKVEVGGVKKAWTRTAPSFLIEDMCHRNMAFTLLHAYQLPQLEIDSVWVTDIGNGLKRELNI